MDFMTCLANLKKKSVLDIHSGEQIQKSMTVMFLEMRNMTTVSKYMSPEETFNLFNKFLSIINPIIKAFNGFIYQYTGDVIMAIFPDSADDAIEAGVKMLIALRAYNYEHSKDTSKILYLGIGIDTGPLILGTAGEKDHLAGIVISDVVHIASRLESLTKFFGTPILVSDRLVTNLAHPEKYNSRCIAKVKVKGTDAPVAVHEILEGNEPAIAKLKEETKELFSEGLNLYHQKKFSEAGIRFSSVLNECPQDVTAHIYFRRTGKYVWEGIPEGWTGIQEVVEKEGNF